MTRLISMVDEVFWCACLRSLANDEVSHRLRRGTDISAQRGRVVGESFVMDRSETLQHYVNVLESNNATKRILKKF